MLNRITIMGRLVRDPELRYTQSNTPVASFTVAVDRDFPDKDSGEKQADFINCVAWRNTAEFISKYFHKGTLSVVSGRLQMREYSAKDGTKRTVAEVVTDNIYFGQSRSDNARSNGEPATSSTNNGTFKEIDDDGDLPF